MAAVFLCLQFDANSEDSGFKIRTAGQVEGVNGVEGQEDRIKERIANSFSAQWARRVKRLNSRGHRGQIPDVATPRGAAVVKAMTDRQRLFSTLLSHTYQVDVLSRYFTACHIFTIMIAVTVIIAIAVHLSLSLFLSLSKPNWWRQMAAHPEPGSVWDFCLLKGSFSSPPSPSACSQGGNVGCLYIWCWPAL